MSGASHLPKDKVIYALAKALLFYAKGRHYVGLGEAGWDAPDEPNWLCAPIERPTDEQLDGIIIEDGGVAAAALRKAFGRKLTQYQHHTSRGEPAALVCQHHRIEAECFRCHPERMPI